MYPYKIIWATENLVEIHENESYGYVEDITELQTIIHKYIEMYIKEYEHLLRTYEKSFPLKIFFELVNGTPFWNFIFLKIKYFDFYTTKTWMEYEVNESELADFYISAKAKVLKN